MIAIVLGSPGTDSASATDSRTRLAWGHAARVGTSVLAPIRSIRAATPAIAASTLGRCTSSSTSGSTAGIRKCRTISAMSSASTTGSPWRRIASATAASKVPTAGGFTKARRHAPLLAATDENPRAQSEDLHRVRTNRHTALLVAGPASPSISATPAVVVAVTRRILGPQPVEVVLQLGDVRPPSPRR